MTKFIVHRIGEQDIDFFNIELEVPWYGRVVRTSLVQAKSTSLHISAEVILHL